MFYSPLASEALNRRSAKSLGHRAPDGRPPPLIDQAHRLMRLWRAGDEAKVNAYISAISGVAPARNAALPLGPTP